MYYLVQNSLKNAYLLLLIFCFYKPFKMATQFLFFPNQAQVYVWG